MATPAVADLGNATVAVCGRGSIKRKSVTIGGGDVNTDSASIVDLVAGQSVALVGSSSSVVGSAAVLTWGSKDSAGTVTVIGKTGVANGTSFVNALKSQIAANIVSRPGETLVVQSDVAITLYLSLIQADRIDNLYPNT